MTQRKRPAPTHSGQSHENLFFPVSLHPQTRPEKQSQGREWESKSSPAASSCWSLKSALHKVGLGKSFESNVKWKL